MVARLGKPIQTQRLAGDCTSVIRGKHHDDKYHEVCCSKVSGIFVERFLRHLLCIMSTHCCKRMADELSKTCDAHPDRFECPDAIMHFSPRAKTYGLIIHDGGSSVIEISFCPWCGTSLRSKRESR
jgi:hypothetical protein